MIIGAMHHLALLFLCSCLLADSSDQLPSLPSPDQVDIPDNIPFIVPSPDDLPGVVVDNTQAAFVGIWQHSIHTPPFVGKGYVHDMKEKKGQKSATFTPHLPIQGMYEVRLAHNSNIRRADNVPLTIKHAKGVSWMWINQSDPAPIDKLFRSLGIFEFKQGDEGSVTISTEGTQGKYVIVDAVQFIPSQQE